MLPPIRSLAVTVAVFLAPATVVAHHSAASHYLIDQTITVKGVVTEFRLSIRMRVSISRLLEKTERHRAGSEKAMLRYYSKGAVGRTTL
jgi:glycerol-3-phosphate acyltransferase PlsY